MCNDVHDFDRDVVRSFKLFMDRVVQSADAGGRAVLSPLGMVVTAHLGIDASTLPVVSESITDHRLVDADIALTVMTAPSH